MTTKTATHAEMAARLLRGAASFYRSISNDNPRVKDELEINAKSCEMTADRVESDPLGEAPRLVDGEEAEAQLKAGK